MINDKYFYIKKLFYISRKCLLFILSGIYFSRSYKKFKNILFFLLIISNLIIILLFAIFFVLNYFFIYFEFFPIEFDFYIIFGSHFFSYYFLN